MGVVVRNGETEITENEQAVRVSAPEIEIVERKGAGKSMKSRITRHLPAILETLAIILALASLAMRIWM